ncbi:hypothetical protein KKP04_12875 [Rhodomicrobium sp. Az07]|uniref:hypothetical protein n=1 Tax=Rhodomicrobium sp. Az07 TaxID=2839034 RepID=UPI001BE6D7E8|nr:hypothetical protein [Rhodomicrobium sp. Az07]MBT3071758.1 hypothetical protein [Rhodomicrobium sp. Az07]
MRFVVAIVAALLVAPQDSYPAEVPDIFHDKIEAVALQFSSLNIPDLEKIQLPQPQADGSLIFLYIWLPQTHAPSPESFEANIADYFDVTAPLGHAFAGWCYLRKPETYTLKTVTGEIAVQRIRALAFRRKPPLARCQGGVPGAAGRLGQTQVFVDPRSGVKSMVRSGHPTRFPPVSQVR